jgi:hypothetical protein
MFKTIFSWLICWSLLAFSFDFQENEMAVFVLLCVGYIPLVVLILTYIFELAGNGDEEIFIPKKKAQLEDFKKHVLAILVMSILLILSLYLPQVTQEDRALKVLLVYAIAMFLTATALVSLVDAFISKKK